MQADAEPFEDRLVDIQALGVIDTRLQADDVARVFFCGNQAVIDIDTTCAVFHAYRRFTVFFSHDRHDTERYGTSQHFDSANERFDLGVFDIAFVASVSDDGKVHRLIDDDGAIRRYIAVFVDQRLQVHDFGVVVT